MTRSLVLILVAAATLASSLAEERRDAIPLFQPAPMAPKVTADSGLAPRVEVSLTVDARGRVASVIVDKVAPASEFDAAFASAVETTLRRWRFLPAMKQGNPVEQSFRWIIDLPQLEGDPFGGVESLLNLIGDDEIFLFGLGETAESEKRRQELLRLSVDQKEAIRSNLARKAEELLVLERRVAVEGRHFIVVTDSPEKKNAGRISRNLDRVVATTYELLQPLIASQPAPGKVLVFVFSTESAYHEFHGKAESFDWSVGFYHPAGVVAFHLELNANSELLNVLFHEAVHAMMDWWLVRPGVRLPTWIGEGFATYIGNSDVREGRIQPGQHRTKVTAPVFVDTGRGFAEQMQFETSAATLERVVKKAIKKKEAIAFSELISASPDQFYGPQRQLFYAESWMAIHFLRHGDDKWSEEEFPRFLLYVAEGHPAEEVLEFVYGVTAKDLNERFTKYCRKF